MMKKLLLCVLLFFAMPSIVLAQTKVWDFGNDDVTWPSTSATIGPGTETIIDFLGLYSNNPTASAITNFGAINSNNTTFTDGYIAARRFQLNGAGYPTGPFQPMPTQRYLFVDVTGACTIKVWFRPGSNSAQRTIYITNGVDVVGQNTSNTNGNLDPTIVTAAAPAAGRYYIYGDTACNLFKVEVSGASVNTSLSVNNFNPFTPTVYSNKNQIFISNLLSATEVKVYNVLGTLVKSTVVNSDSQFELDKGFYIVNLKSNEGEKSVKVFLN